MLATGEARPTVQRNVEDEKVPLVRRDVNAPKTKVRYESGSLSLGTWLAIAVLSVAVIAVASTALVKARDASNKVDLVVGLPGSNGTSGAQGPTGPRGPVGFNGTAGATGPTGSTGPAGSAGSAGSAGATGATGPAGPAGSAGSAGSTGATGATGPAGPAGAAGSAGSAGATGATGPAGPAGSAGSAGATGPTGPTAVSGVQLYVHSTSGNGGDSTTNTWVVRTLNLAKDGNMDNIYTSLSNNQVTIQAGTYSIEADAPAFQSGSHAIRLVLGGTNTEVAMGTAEWSATSTSPPQTRSFLSYYTTITSPTAYSIQHSVSSGKTTNGFGASLSGSQLASSNIYARMRIVKHA